MPARRVMICVCFIGLRPGFSGEIFALLLKKEKGVKEDQTFTKSGDVWSVIRVEDGLEDEACAEGGVDVSEIKCSAFAGDVEAATG